MTEKKIKKQSVPMPHMMSIYDKLKYYIFDCSSGGNSTNIVKKMTLECFMNQELNENNQLYIFHDMLKNKIMFDIISNIIEVPKVNKKMRVSRLYVGSKGSGTNIHTHSVAINYLINGEKLWFLFPNTEKNNKLLKSINSEYGNVKDTAMEWFLKNYDFLESNFEDFETMTQVTGEYIIVPDGYHHGVINMKNVFGITYSWY